MDIIASGVEKKLVFLCFLRHWALFTQNVDLDYFSKSGIQLFLLELFTPVLLNFRQISSDYKLVDLDMPASHKYYKKKKKKKASLTYWCKKNILSSRSKVTSQQKDDWHNILWFVFQRNCPWQYCSSLYCINL